jgi:hypothetical protein
MRVNNSTTVSMIALAFVCLGASPLLAEETHGAKIRWDIFRPEVGTTSITIAPGGHSISQATFSSVQNAGDNSTITLTGSGTFDLGESNDASGGGTWETATAAGAVIATGTYRVTGLVRFELAPGSLAGVPGFVDAIGNVADTRAGLAVLRVAYSDGAKGILVLSCNFGPPAPAAVFEGTTATKGFVDYYNALFPDFTFGNTIFHVIHEDKGD